MAWNTFKKNGQNAKFMGYEVYGTMTKGTHENMAAYITTAGKAAVGSANQPLRGVIKTIDVDGTEVNLQIGGIAADVPYTGTAPTAGAWNWLECGASGAVQIDATNGKQFFVESVDTVAGTCVIDLG